MTSLAAACYEAAGFAPTGAFVIVDAPDPKDKPGRTFQVWSISSVGIEMGLCILIGFGIGYWLDIRYDTAPYLMLLFLLFGIAAGFKALFRAARQAKDAAAESEDKRP